MAATRAPRASTQRMAVTARSATLDGSPTLPTHDACRVQLGNGAVARSARSAPLGLHPTALGPRVHPALRAGLASMGCVPSVSLASDQTTAAVHARCVQLALWAPAAHARWNARPARSRMSAESRAKAAGQANTVPMETSASTARAKANTRSQQQDARSVPLALSLPRTVAAAPSAV